MITYAAIPNYGIPDRALPKYAIVGVYVVAVVEKKSEGSYPLPREQRERLLLHQQILREDAELLTIIRVIVKLL